MPRSHHLKSLTLRNFKGIAELDLSFDESLTLLAGVNGVGKTSVMQALVAAVTATWDQLTNATYPRFVFRESVVRSGADRAEIVLGVKVTRPTIHPVIRFYVDVDGPRLKGGLCSLGIGEALAEHVPPPPPVVYYEQDRLSPTGPSGKRDVPVSPDKMNQVGSPGTTATSQDEFKSWFFEKETDESQEVRDRKGREYEDPELAAVRGLLPQLGGFTAVRSRRPSGSSERILFLKKDGTDIPFDSLSGGEQAFFLLAADLARRLMAASPHTPLAEVPGIVCIDEIELHLHPAWQRRILRTLMKTFPACQFVVSTHSPQVIGGVEARHVRLLTLAESGRRKVSQPIASMGRDSNYVLRGILDTPERDDRVNHLLMKFDRLVDAGKLEAAERVLDQLDEAIEGQSSAVAIRQARWNRLHRTAE